MGTTISGSRARVLWSSQKYFSVKKMLSGSIDLFVSVGLLVAVLKFKEKTVRNGINNNRQRLSNYWSFFIDLSAIFINWATLPANSLNRLGLPSAPEEMLDLLRENEKLTEEQFKSLTAQQLKSKLEDIYNHHYARYLKFYLPHYHRFYERKRYAQSHALMEEVIKMKKEKWNRAMIYNAYWQIIVGEIAEGNDPVLELGNAHYFWQKIRLAEKGTIESVLVSKAKGVPREYRVKLTGPIRAHIRTKLRIQHMTYPAIVRSVEKKFKVKIDVSSVKKFKINKEVKNLVEYDSNGVGYSRINSMPKLERELASSPGEQYMADFYDVIFYVRTMGGEPVALIAFIIIDTFSRKIVGWALGRLDDTDNREKVAIAAFRMAFLETCWMPEEILMDRDPYYRRPAFKRFKKKVMNLGVDFPPCPPSFAPFRAEIESILGAFQLKVCSEKPFFKGADSRSRRHYKVGNPSQEFLNEMWLHKDKFPVIHEFEKQFGVMVIEKNTNFYESAA